MSIYNKLPISLVMVVYNEEKLIERALKSAYDLVDEIIIVHDGHCSDKTLEIAKKYTSNIFIKDHTGESESHRVFTYEKAKNDWILQLDGDEFLSIELRKNISSLINVTNRIYLFSWPVWHKNKAYYWDYKAALFRKSEIYFIGSPHEYPKPINKSVNYFHTDFRLMHEPLYDNLTWNCFKTKWNHWAIQHAKFFNKDFKKIPKWNYLNNDWELKTRLRLNHPIILGIVCGFFFSILFHIKFFIGKKNIYYLKQGLYSGLYQVLIWYYYIIYKNSK